MTEKGTYEEIQGDITTVIDGTIGKIILPHVCNNIGVYGAGVALAIKNKWGLAEYFYMKHCNSWKKDGEINPEIIGSNSYVRLEENSVNLCIVNMIAQNGLRSTYNPRPLNYGALSVCMKDILIEQKDFIPGARICTVKFGSGLAGGNWYIIKELIDFIWIRQGINVTVYCK